MTIARTPGDEKADETGWPWSHRKGFLERLAAQGYAAVTIQEYLTIAGRFCDAIEKRGLRIDELDGATTERLRHSVLSGVTGSARSYAKFCARRFIDHLSEAGAPAAVQPQSKKLTPLDRLRGEYEDYLRKQRGLAESRALQRKQVVVFGDCRHFDVRGGVEAVARRLFHRQSGAGIARTAGCDSAVGRRCQS
jgi:hypothetical protein